MLCNIVGIREHSPLILPLVLALIRLALVFVSADCWSDWSDWSQCTKACGCGRQFRVRFCNCAYGQGHAQCQGLAESSQSCNCQACPNGPPFDENKEGIYIVFNDEFQVKKVLEPRVARSFHFSLKSIEMVENNETHPPKFSLAFDYTKVRAARRSERKHRFCRGFSLSRAHNLSLLTFIPKIPTVSSQKSALWVTNDSHFNLHNGVVKRD